MSISKVAKSESLLLVPQKGMGEDSVENKVLTAEQNPNVLIENANADSKKPQSPLVSPQAPVNPNNNTKPASTTVAQVLQTTKPKTPLTQENLKGNTKKAKTSAFIFKTFEGQIKQAA